MSFVGEVGADEGALLLAAVGPMGRPGFLLALGAAVEHFAAAYVKYGYKG